MNPFIILLVFLLLFSGAGFGYYHSGYMGMGYCPAPNFMSSF